MPTLLTTLIYLLTTIFMVNIYFDISTIAFVSRAHVRFPFTKSKTVNCLRNYRVYTSL